MLWIAAVLAFAGETPALGVAIAAVGAQVRPAPEARSVGGRELRRVFAPSPDRRGRLSQPELRICHAQLVGCIAGVVERTDEIGIPETP
jgi:hypothetical protein